MVWMRAQCVGRAEGVALARDDDHGCGDRGQVGNAELIGFGRRVQRVTEDGDAGKRAQSL